MRSEDQRSPGNERSDFAVLDDATVDRILEERDPGTAPSGYIDATRALVAASAPGSPDDAADEALVLAAYRRAISDAEARSGRRRVVARLGRARVAAAVLVVGLATGGSLAAAATGSLPGPAQRIASDVLGLAGIKVPDAHGGPRRPNPIPANSPANDHDGSAPMPARSSLNSGPPSTALGSPAGAEPARMASPAFTPIQPVGSSSRWSSGATGGATGSSGQSGNNGNGKGHSNTAAGGPPGLSGNKGNGNGNGNAKGHSNTAAGGPPGQSDKSGSVNGNNGSANGNGNGNAKGHSNTAAGGPPGQSGNKGNGNGGGPHG